MKAAVAHRADGQGVGTQAGRARVEIRVANLDCKHDGVVLRRALLGRLGVTEVDVRPNSGAVVVRFNSDESSPDVIRQALAEAGFPSRGIRVVSVWV